MIDAQHRKRERASAGQAGSQAVRTHRARRLRGNENG